MKGLADLLFGACLTSPTPAVKVANLFESEALTNWATLFPMSSCIYICQTRAVTQVLAMSWDMHTQHVPAMTASNDHAYTWHTFSQLQQKHTY